MRLDKAQFIREERMFKLDDHEGVRLEYNFGDVVYVYINDMRFYVFIDDYGRRAVLFWDLHDLEEDYDVLYDLMPRDVQLNDGIRVNVYVHDDGIFITDSQLTYLIRQYNGVIKALEKVGY
ncbi:MAG: hypothetical protein GX295_12220 [Syntrophomonadaceae bacterium]|nr:hypothetical protein [Syntrophomonadaceae bacterium]